MFSSRHAICYACSAESKGAVPHGLRTAKSLLTGDSKTGNCCRNCTSLCKSLGLRLLVREQKKALSHTAEGTPGFQLSNQATLRATTLFSWAQHIGLPFGGRGGGGLNVLACPISSSIFRGHGSAFKASYNALHSTCTGHRTQEATLRTLQVFDVRPEALAASSCQSA